MKQQITKIATIVLALLLAVATLTLLPQTRVEATAGKKALMFGDTGIANMGTPLPTDLTAWRGDYLYWGKNSMKWQILNKKATEFGDIPGMLILSEELGLLQFNLNQADGNGYVGSVLDKHLTSQYDSLLNEGEKEATLGSTNTDEHEYKEYNLEFMKDQVFIDKKWFAPTGKMMSKTEYGFSSNAREFDQTRLVNSNNHHYWLSSLRINNKGAVGTVTTTGPLDNGWVSNRSYSRGASKINTTSLLFVSAANGGKSGSTTGADILASVSDSTNGEWKFTLKDDKQKITKQTVKRIARDKVEITLNKVGNGTSISAITTDESGSNIMHYGRVASVTSGPVNDAKVTITLPEEVINGTEKLKIFTEEYTNEKSTDYASDLYDVMIPPYEVSNIVVTSERDKTSIVEGETLQMVANVTPSDAANNEVTWSVSNTGIALITPTGLLTSAGVGEVIVTATAKDGSGVVGTKTITITKKPVLVTDVKITSKNSIVSVPEGKTLQLNASMAPDSATIKEVTWSISNKARSTSVASIDASGVVTGNFVGTVNVVATAKDGSGIFATVTVRVVERGSVVLPGNIIIKPAPDGTPPVENSDGTVTVPNGGIVEYPNGNIVEAPRGGKISPEGVLTLLDGTSYDKDGSIVSKPTIEENTGGSKVSTVDTNGVTIYLLGAMSSLAIIVLGYRKRKVRQ